MDIDQYFVLEYFSKRKYEINAAVSSLTAALELKRLNICCSMQMNKDIPLDIILVSFRFSVAICKWYYFWCRIDLLIYYIGPRLFLNQTF